MSWFDPPETATVTVTVTEDKPGFEGYYHWNYYVRNETFHPNGDVPGVGHFVVRVEEPEAVVAVGVGSSAQTSGWAGQVGGLFGDPYTVTWSHPSPGNALAPGEEGDFWFTTPARPVIETLGEVYEPSVAYSAWGYVRGPGRKPTVDLRIAGLDDATEATSPGKKIHINDNFDEGMTYGPDDLYRPDGTRHSRGLQKRVDSDYLPNRDTGKPEIKDGDTDVVNATLAISAGVQGALTWTNGAHVNVFWKDTSSKWVLVTNQQNFTAPAQPIELRIEGKDIGVGTIKVEFRAGVAGPAEPDEAAYTVYTGLKITGDTTALANKLREQVERATSWTTKKDAAGNVWRLSGLIPDLPAIENWERAVWGYFDTILRSQTQTAVKAVHMQFLIGRFDDGLMDPEDIAVIFQWSWRWGSAILVHEFVEQYEKQVNGITAFDNAHSRAKDAEGIVYVGTAGRTDTSVQLPTGFRRSRFSYAGGVAVEFDWDPTRNTNIIEIRVP
jgi:hypothetical protein